MQKIRKISRLAFILIFLLVMISGKAQFWMGFIFLSIFLAAFAGRFYCGWACPINTLIGPVGWVSEKVGLKKKSIPDFIRSGIPRIILFGMFIVGLGYTIYTITQGRKFPLPLIIIPIGLLVTLFINETAWHRYLCPWGTLFSLTGRFARLGFASSGCRGCTKCQQVCPSDSVRVIDDQAVFSSANCLQCFSCKDLCKAGAISFGAKRQD